MKNEDEQCVLEADVKNADCANGKESCYAKEI